MRGHQDVAAQLFYDFRIEDHVLADHILRRIEGHLDLESVHCALKPYYSNTRRPSIDPDLMMRMLIIGYAMGIRLERRLCEGRDIAPHIPVFDKSNRTDGTFSENPA
jgi:transposase